jgi:hypothetical protein
MIAILAALWIGISVGGLAGWILFGREQRKNSHVRTSLHGWLDEMTDITAKYYQQSEEKTPVHAAYRVH